MAEQRANRARALTPRERWVVAVCCGLMFAYGVFLGAIQTVIAAVAEGLHTDTAGMGMLVSAQFFPATFVPVWMGAVSDRVGRRPVLAAFCAVFAAGLAICGSARAAWMYVLGAVAVGAGYSVLESGCCAVMSDLGPEWGTRGINLTQALLCLGAVLSPMAVRGLHLTWRETLYGCSAFYIALLPLILTARFPVPVAANRSERGGVRALFSSRAFILLFAAMVLYVGMESGFGYFIESLFSLRFAGAPLSCVSMYWLGMMISRFVFSAIRYPARPVTAGGYALCAAMFAALVLCTHVGAALALCFVTGFVFGPLWSTVMAEALARYPRWSGTASGVMSAGCGAGGIVFPAVTGLVARQFSLTAAFGLMGAVALAGAVLCALVGPPKEYREN